jgi:hypothetical protein
MIGAAHAVYAPSSAERWTVCTASAEAIAVLGEDNSGEEAQEGTAAHDEIERILGPSGTNKDAVLPKFDPEHPAAYGIALVLDYVRQLPPGRMWIEQRVELTTHVWGRCDVAHYDPVTQTLTIVDYKNGFVPVDAEENEQLIIYAGASIFTHNLAVKWVRLVVVQPNDWRPVPRVKQWVTMVDHIYARVSAWAAIPKAPKSFIAGEHCRYCPLFGRCEASRDLLAKLAIALQHKPEEVPAATRAIYLALKKPIEDWFKQAEKVWLKDALEGKALAGLKAIRTQPHRCWNDVDVAREYIMALQGAAVLDPPSPAQAEKLGIDKKWVEANSSRPEGAPALAFESDKRPAFTQKTGAEMFAALLPGGAKK